jgi:hypothetical protein
MAIGRSSGHHPMMEVVMNNAWHTLTDLRRLIDRKEASALEITDGYLARIDRAENTLHAFTEVFHDAARALARAADAAQASGLPMGPLHGLPIVLKDAAIPPHDFRHTNCCIRYASDCQLPERLRGTPWQASVVCFFKSMCDVWPYIGTSGCTSLS